MGYDGLNDLLAQLVLLKQVRNVASSGIRSLIRSMPEKRRMVGTSIRACQGTTASISARNFPRLVRF